jgi:hypothetical protein
MGDSRRRGENGPSDRLLANVGPADDPRGGRLAEAERFMMCRASECSRERRQVDASPSSGRRKLDR